MAQTIKKAWKKIVFAVLCLVSIILGSVLPPVLFPPTPPTAGIGSATLTVDGFTADYEQWEEIGDSPWISAQDQPSHYLNSTNSNQTHGWFTFSNLPEEATSIINVSMNSYGQRVGAFHLKFWLYNGSWIEYDHYFGTTWNWLIKDATATLPTVALVNSAILALGSYNGGAYGLKVDCVNITVSYTYQEPTNILYVDSWNNTISDNWLEVGNSPYIDNTDSYITVTGWDNNATEAWFGFQNTSYTESEFGNVSNIYLEIYGNATVGNLTRPYINNGTTTFDCDNYQQPTSNGWIYVNITNVVNTYNGIQLATLKIFSPMADFYYINIIKVCLHLYNSTEEPPTPTVGGNAPACIDTELSSVIENTTSTFSATFEVKYTLAYMHGFYFEHNLTGTLQNDTWQSFSNFQQVITAEVNKTLPSNGTTVKARFYANDTYNKWCSSPPFDLWTIESYPSLIHKEINGSVILGEPLRKGASFYYEGAAQALYWAYMNSTCGMYQAVGYDYSSAMWTNPINISEPYSVDGHWSCSISHFPNGSIFVIYGYFEHLKYRYTLESANTQGNLTTLLSNWSSEIELTSETDSTSCYPMAVAYEDKVLVFYRNGTSINGMWDILKFENNVWETSYNFIKEGNTTVDPHSMYVNTPYKEDGYLVISGFRNFKESTSNSYYLQDGFLVYSVDNGTTWCNVTGHQQNLPILMNNIITANTTQNSSQILCFSTAIVNDKPVQAYHPYYAQQWLENVSLYVWNSTLNSTGQWEWFYPKDERGRSITFLTIYYDDSIESLVGIANIPSLNTTVGYFEYGDAYKVVFDSNNFSRCERLFKIANNSNVGEVPIYDSPQLYERCGQVWGIAGLGTTIWTDLVNGLTTNMTYGTKFTATETIKIYGFQTNTKKGVFTAEAYTMALYNSTKYKIEECYETAGLSVNWAYKVSYLKNPVTIVEGQEYWIVVSVKYWNANISYTQSTSINQTFQLWTNYTFPDQISGETYLNITIDTYAYNTYVHFWGLKSITALEVGWNTVLPWSVDVGKTLQQVNASLTLDGIDYSVVSIQYSNGSRYAIMFWDGEWIGDWNVAIPSDGTFFIYANVADEWYHTYS